MKKIILLSMLFILFISAACSSQGKKGSSDIWLTNLEKAEKIAGEKNVPILVNFTGSDWCVWCERLRNEVFNKQEFKDYAKDNLVLVKLDFPRNLKQSEEVKRYNRRLLNKYGVRGFPTILILDAKGKVLSQLGYQPGGPKAFIETLEESVTFKEKHKEDVYVDEGGLTWFLSLEKAEEIASKEHKPIFVNFTGSDWCVWCKKLYNEVFSKPEFIEYAKENLVLLRFDFPRQTPQSAGLKAYNQQMAGKYEIRGFPTILLLDENGEKIAQLGYQEGGPIKYIETIKSKL